MNIWNAKKTFQCEKNISTLHVVTPEPIDMPFVHWVVSRPDLIIPAKFYVNRLTGFSEAATPKVPFRILIRTTFTTQRFRILLFKSK